MVVGPGGVVARKKPASAPEKGMPPESLEAVKLRLSESLAGTPEPMAILHDVAAIVGRFLGVSRVAYGEIDPGSDWITIPTEWTAGVPPMIGRHALHRNSGFVREYVLGRTMAVDDVAALDLVPAEAAMMKRTFCRSCISVPLVRDGELVGLFSATHRAVRRWSDEEIALVEHAAARTWTALEHSRVVARLKESEAQFRMLAENVPGHFWVGDENGQILWGNQQWREYFAGTGGLRGQGEAIVHPDDLAASLALWKRARRDGAPIERVVRLRGADDSYRPFLSRAVPVRDAAGAVIRWCGVQIDLSEKEAQDRRHAFLRALYDAIRDERDATVILGTLVRMVTDHLSIRQMTFLDERAGEPGVYNFFYAVDGKRLAWPSDTFEFGEGQEELVGFYERGRTLVVDDSAGFDADAAKDVRHWAEMMRVKSGIITPLVKEGRVAVILSILSDVPRRWTHDEIGLCEELTELAWSAVSRARAQQALEQRERHQAFLLDWSDRVRGATSPDAIIALTIERLGTYLGISRANYAEPDADGQGFSILQEWRSDGTLTGMRHAVSEGVLDDYLEGDIVICENAAADPRFDEDARRRYAEVEALAFLGAPMVREGGVRAVLSVQHAEPRRWHPFEIQLLGDIAERTWILMERARAEAALKERERHQAIVLAWSDRVREEATAEGVLAATLDQIGRSFAASRVTYVEAGPDSMQLRGIQEWNGGAVSRTVGREFPLAALGAEGIAEYRRGKPIVMRDVTKEPGLAGFQDFYARIGTRAMLSEPLVRDGAVIAALGIQQDAPRAWTEAEIQLLHDLADRTWAILERRRSEERLNESEALLAAFMDNAPIAMYLKDEAGCYVRVNREMAVVLGCEVGEALGRTTRDLFPGHVAEQVADLDRLAMTGGVHAAEIEVGDRDRYATVLSVRFAVPAYDGRATRLGGFVIDLTERRATEAALEQSRASLYQTEKLSALGSLLAGVSHELNNPLSIVVAQAVMLERQTGGSALAERAQKIRKAADRCARIVQTFLAMARQKRPERKPVDLNDVAAAAIELAGYGLKVEGIAVDRQFAEGLPQISADADQLHQIIINLVVNAQQAMTEAGGEMTLSVRTALGPEPKTVILEVADTGPGVPEEARRRIFEPFYTTKPQGSGTGVGLSFSQGLAEAHGGRLALMPSAQGAVFRVTLPIDREQTLPPLAPEAAIPEIPTGKRALVIDDEAEIAEALADFLSIEGFQCDIAVGGAAAKTWLAEGDYDLIVSDIRMPGVDGPQLHAWIAAERPDLADRLAFATGDTLGTVASNFLAAVDRPVLEKPFTLEAVRDFVRRMERA